MVKRVVQTVSESEDHTRVKIRTVYEPIFSRLWEISKPHIKYFQTDLIHDALTLGDSEVGDKFLWGFRESGTNMMRLKKSHSATTLSVIATMVNPLESYHLIEITNIRTGGHADGYVTWINAKTVDDLKRVIEDNTE